MKYIAVSIVGVFFIILCAAFFILYAPTADAACSASTRAEGLISAKNITGKFGTTALGGACVTGDASSFISFKVPTYDELKTNYYDLAKIPSDQKETVNNDLGEGGLLTRINAGKKIIYLKKSADGTNGNLNIAGSMSGTNTALVFVDGNLTFTSASNPFTYGNGQSGIVFIVKGNIIIEPAVARIDAILISAGTIYTAGNNCTTNSVLINPAVPLIINGSIVSLTPTSPPKFCRTFQTNTVAAEEIRHQPKYLVILRDLLAGQLQIWKELATAPAATASGFDYTINNTGGPVTIVRGGSNNSIVVRATLAVTATNNQNVSFTISNLPTGVTASFSPTYCLPTPSGCISTLTLNSTSAAEIVSGRTVTITGSPLSKSTTFNLNVSSAAPTVTTITPLDTIANTTATLKGSVNPNGLSTTAYFKWGASNAACNSLTNQTANQTFTGTSSTNYSQSITGLTAGTPYYFCAIASNSDPASPGLGGVQSFTTTSCGTKTIGTTQTIGQTLCI